jgi:tetrahydromethanopterin S-methyltransferase subunit G
MSPDDKEKESADQFEEIEERLEQVDKELEGIDEHVRKAEKMTEDMYKWASGENKP